jgi:hypothetical protein
MTDKLLQQELFANHIKSPLVEKLAKFHDKYNGKSDFMDTSKKNRA